MPYSPGNPPEAIKALPAHAKQIWISAFNAAFDKYGETRAFKIAWAAVKNAGYRQNASGEWVKGHENYSWLAAAETTSVIDVLRVGEWEWEDYGKISITDEMLDDLMFNFEAKVRGADELPIDVEHMTNDPAGAAGWIRTLSRENGTLKAEVEWTDRGQELISNKRFRFISAEYAPEYADPETGRKFKNVLIAATLTNRPRIKGMEPLNLSEFPEEAEVIELRDEPKHDEIQSMIDKLSELLVGLTPALKGRTGTPAMVHSLRDMRRRLMAFAKTLPEDTEEPAGEPETEVTELADEEKKLTEKPTAPEGYVMLSMSELADMKGQMELSRQAGRRADFRYEWLGWLRDKKVIPAQEDALREVYMSEPDQCRKLVQAQGVMAPTLGELGFSSTGGDIFMGGSSKGSGQAMLRFNELIKSKQDPEKHGADYGDALVAAARENPELAQEARKEAAGGA